MGKRLSLLIAGLALATSVTMAQSSISGTVVDANGDPIIGASVRVEGSRIGVATDVNGHFSLNAPAGSKLLISYIGMEDKQVKASSAMRITMNSDEQSLDDVVVVAYGTAKRSALTGAVSNVDAKQLAVRPVSSVASALEGTTTGVMVNSTYGQPGSDPSIRIRGISTVNGSNSPLYVIDGVPFGGNISDLSPDDIESLTVLKDASSAALYGNRAANGVILITTKRAKGIGTRVTGGVTLGTYTRGIAEYDRLGANDWMEMMWQGYRNNALTTGTATAAEANAYTNEHLIDQIGYNIYNMPIEQLFDANGKINSNAQILAGIAADRDWYKVVERHGFRQQYDMTAQAASEKTSLYFSTSYLKEDGYIKNSGFDRITGMLNGDIRPTKWLKTGLSINASHQKADYTNGSSTASYTNPFMYARSMAPIYPVHLHDMTTGEYILDENGNKVYDDGSENGRPQYNARHVAWENELNTDRSFRNTVNSKLYATFFFLNDFSFTLAGNLNLRNEEYRTYNNAIIGDGAGNNGRAKREIYRYKNYTVQQQLNWAHVFGGKHSVDALLAHEAFKYRYNYLYGYKTSQNFAGQQDLVNFTNITDLTDYENNYRTESYLGRVRYSYDDKYNGEFSFRRDGSSRFAKDNRWGNFWSIGGSWVISSEEFMKPFTWLNDLKLRASYGEVGNDGGVGYYGYMALYTMEQNGLQGALYKSQNSAPDIKWETAQSFGVALEGQAFDHRLNFSIEYYDKRNKDLLFSVYQPLSAGATSSSAAVSTVSMNLGTMSNKGIELHADYDFIHKKDWTWNVGLNLAHNSNKVVKLPEQNREDGIISGARKIMEGHSVYEFWTYQFVGVDQMTGRSLYEFDTEKYYPEGADAEDGKTAVAAKNLVTINGKTYTTNTTYGRRDWSGKALPDLDGSITTSLRWKDLTLGAILTYSLGGKVYDESYVDLMSMSGSPHALHKDILKSWNGVPEGMTEDSPNRIDPNGIPEINFKNSAENNSTSNRWLHNRSFLVIKNINLSYQLPRSLVRSWGLQSIAINGSIENLATFTHLKGMNPQATFDGFSENYLVTPRVFTMGIKVAF